MLRWSPADIAGRSGWPEELENVANPDFGDIQHLQNHGDLPMTAPITILGKHTS